MLSPQMPRRLLLVFAVIAIYVTPARAQGMDAVAGLGLSLGYVTLGIAAGTRLLEGSVAAGLGDSLAVTWRAAGRWQTIRGRFTAADRDSIVVGPTRIARADLRGVHVYAGQERKWAQGWAWGFFGGGTTGAVLGFASGNDPSGDIALTAKDKAAILGVVGAVSGSVAGTLIGLATTGDHWRSVSWVPDPPRVGFEPIVGRSIGVAAHVSF